MSSVRKTLIFPLLFIITFGTFFSLTKAIDSSKTVWFIVFAVMTMILMLTVAFLIVGSIRGGTPLTNHQKKKLWAVALTAGIILGLLFIIFSPDMSDKEHDYIVNGVRMSERSEDFSTRFSGSIAMALITVFLVDCFGSVFMKFKLNGDRWKMLLRLALIIAVIAAGVFGGRMLGQYGGGKYAISEEVFLADPASVRDKKFVFFGTYPQNGSMPEPIKWRVIEKHDDRLVLMSEFALDTSSYTEDMFSVTYADSIIRGFLRNSFAEEAFSQKERSMLIAVPVGNGEKDIVSLLTQTQAEKLFGKYSECPATENVKDKLQTSKRGDSEYYIRPDAPEDTDIYYYMLAENYTPHTRLSDTSFDFNLRGVRPVIVVGVN